MGRHIARFAVFLVTTGILFLSVIFVAVGLHFFLEGASVVTSVTKTHAPAIYFAAGMVFVALDDIMQAAIKKKFEK